MALYDDFLLTVDFDRTLTAPDSTIPQRNLDAIHYFMENGGAFTVNTGRSVPMFRRFLDQIPANAPFLLYNGSAAWDNGTLTLIRPIELDMWAVFREIMARYPDLNLELQGIDCHYRIQGTQAWNKFCQGLGCAHAFAAPEMDLGPFLKFALIGDIREYNVAHLFRGEPAELARMDEVEDWLRSRWGEKISVFRSAPRLIDVQAGGVSKIRAARDLQKRLGRKWLVCVGDAENDIPMLAGADFAYCPADAVVADRFENVCKCADGSVADVIYEKIPEIIRSCT